MLASHKQHWEESKKKKKNLLGHPPKSKAFIFHFPSSSQLYKDMFSLPTKLLSRSTSQVLNTTF